MKRPLHRHLLLPGLVAALTAAGLTAAPGAAAAAPRPAPAGSRASGTSAAPLDTLTGLAAQRLLVSDRVAASKWHTHMPVDDPAREHQELTSLRHRAAAIGLAPDVAETFFRQQFAASRTVQEADLAQWRAHPGRAPVSRPDLKVLRGELNRISSSLLTALAAVQPLRSSPARCDEQMAHARRSVITAHHLDAVHRKALVTATCSVCGRR